MEKKSFVIKGTVLTHRGEFVVGEDKFSSILFSIMNSWYYSNYTFNGSLKEERLAFNCNPASVKSQP